MVGWPTLIPHMNDHIPRGLNVEDHGDFVAEPQIFRGSADIEADHRLALAVIARVQFHDLIFKGRTRKCWHHRCSVEHRKF